MHYKPIYQRNSKQYRILWSNNTVGVECWGYSILIGSCKNVQFIQNNTMNYGLKKMSFRCFFWWLDHDRMALKIKSQYMHPGCIINYICGGFEAV